MLLWKQFFNRKLFLLQTLWQQGFPQKGSAGRCIGADSRTRQAEMWSHALWRSHLVGNWILSWLYNETAMLSRFLPHLGRSRTSTGTRVEVMVGYIEKGGAGRDQFRLQLLPPACSCSRQGRGEQSSLQATAVHSGSSFCYKLCSIVATRAMRRFPCPTIVLPQHTGWSFPPCIQPLIYGSSYPTTQIYKLLSYLPPWSRGWFLLSQIVSRNPDFWLCK